jgi:hypothetical protein
MILAIFQVPSEIPICPSYSEISLEHLLHSGTAQVIKSDLGLN